MGVCSNQPSPGAPAISDSTGVYVAGNAVEGLGGETMQRGDSTTSVGTSELESGWRYDEKLTRKLARKETVAYMNLPHQHLNTLVPSPCVVRMKRPTQQSKTHVL